MSKPRRISNEEQQFGYWLEEAKEHGLVAACEEQPISFELIPKAEILAPGMKKPKFLFHKHSYTPDFLVILTDLGKEILSDAFAPAWVSPEWREHGRLYVDTKGSFTVQHGQEQIFQANRKMLWYYRTIWIAKVVPWISPMDRAGNMKPKAKRSLFTDTFAPDCLRYRSNLVPSNMGRCCKTVQQLIEDKKTLYTESL